MVRQDGHLGLPIRQGTCYNARDMNSAYYSAMAAAVLALGLVSCSSPNFDNIPRNGYIAHMNKAGAEGEGFASCWSAGGTQPAADSRAIYVKPVSLDHYEAHGNATAQARSVIGLRNYFDARLRQTLAAADAANPSFHLVSAPGPGVCTMEVALLSSAPANIKGNAVTTAADNLVGSLAGYLASSSDDSGSVSMGAKFFSPEGELVMEVADWQRGDTDNNQATQVSIGKYSFNVLDFQQYGYARKTADAWAKQLAALFSSARKPAPWYRLSAQ